jgi:hypothetical protein
MAAAVIRYEYLNLLNYNDTIGPFTSATILTSHNSGATAGSALFGNYSLIDTPKLKRVKRQVHRRFACHSTSVIVAVSIPRPNNESVWVLIPLSSLLLPLLDSRLAWTLRVPVRDAATPVDSRSASELMLQHSIHRESATNDGPGG